MIGFLYGQTEYSLLENAIHLDDYINHAINNGFSFLSITDDNLAGHFKFYSKCKEAKIKPVIGLKTRISSTALRDNYILLYAQNKKGYQNLLNIATEQSLNDTVADDFISSHREGLILVSSALDSDFDYYLFEQKYDLATTELERIRNLTDNFYVGIMPSSFVYDTIYQDLEVMRERHKLLFLPLAKCSYLKKEDEIVYQTLLKMNERRIIPGLDDLHLKTANELIREFNNYDDIFDNLEEVINSISDELISTSFDLPKYPNRFRMSSDEYLKKLCIKGLEKRLSQNNIIDNGDYKQRLNYELSLINKMGYSDYFLIVYDFVNYAKKQKYLVGPGRGSAAGSLVSYVLGITEIDPLRYDLLFERFLNPERVSMPDIDMDFPDDKRDDVINYVKEKYGTDHVCYITAFGSFQIKSSVRDLFRVFGYDTKYINPIIRLLETNPSNEKIEEQFANHPELIELIMISKKIEGLPRHISTHAAGIILSNESLFNTIPLRQGLNGMLQSQLEALDLAKMGLLKIDFLGIRNLSIIADVIQEINKNTPFALRDISLDDERTFEMLQKGDTIGIFQLESAGITKVIKKLKPSNFEDIVAVLALYRPGPMDNIEDYINRKHGAKFTYLHPDLEPILKSTYGIIVYQEQIMKIAQTFAGYSLGEADILRRAISKKQKHILEEERIKFVQSCLANGYNEKISNTIYDYIVKFADYGFNRSHSVAYGLFTYQMAYLKANYLSIFLAKLLNNVIGNDSELANYINYAAANGIKVTNPNINISTNRFVVNGNSLVIPINAVHNLGNIATKQIIVERENGAFRSFFDFKKRMGDVINSRMLESLIDAGAFDEFNHSHAYLLQNMDNNFESYIDSSEALVDIKELSIESLEQRELASLGFNVKYDAFQNYQEEFIRYKASKPNDFVLNKTVNVVGIIQNFRVLKTKQGVPMAFININANHELVDAVAFPDVFANYQSVLDEKKLVLFNGIIKERNGNLQLQIIKMKKL